MMMNCLLGVLCAITSPTTYHPYYYYYYYYYYYCYCCYPTNYTENYPSGSLRLFKYVTTPERYVSSGPTRHARNPQY